MTTQNPKMKVVFTLLGLCLALSACGPDAGASSSDELGTVQGASSGGGGGGGGGGGTTGTWPYPVPTGCVSINATQCRTNVGHYDVTEATASLDVNMRAAGYTQRYSPVCRSNLAYAKGTTKVCYRVGVLEDVNHQVIGSQWNGFIG